MVITLGDLLSFCTLIAVIIRLVVDLVDRNDKKK